MPWQKMRLARTFLPRHIYWEILCLRVKGTARALCRRISEESAAQEMKRT